MDRFSDIFKNLKIILYRQGAKALRFDFSPLFILFLCDLPPWGWKKTITFIAFSISLFPAFSTHGLCAQEINKGDNYVYARKIVDTMACKGMHGRGYVNEGDKIAANYIRSEFKKLGLKSFKEDYYQPFTFSINTFPEKVNVQINKVELIPGKDFIVAAHAPSYSGKHPAIVADEALVLKKRKLKNFLKQDFKDKIIVVNDTGKTTPALQDLQKNSVKAAAVVVLKDKLTWSASQAVTGYPLLEILRTSINEPKEIALTIENKLIRNYQSQNIIGYIKGTVYADSFIVFSAHYDHLGQMGKDVYFPGANDNASGCAMLLNIAKHYSLPQNQPKYSIAFIAFGAEEVGLLGSKHYTENPLFPLSSIRFLLNMDTGDDGITVVNGSVFKEEFNSLVKLNVKNNFIKDVKTRGKAANSDHYFFSEKGVKAFFIYTMGGIKAYHDIYDRAETLPLNEFEDLFRLITSFSTYLQN